MSGSPARYGGGRLEGHGRRNFWLCVGNGAIVSMGSAFFSFETVMAGLTFTLTGSTLLVGLVTAMATSCWLWPQLIVGSYIEHRPRKMPVYRLSVALRVIALSLMTLALWLLSDRPYVLYSVLLLGTIAFASGGGMCVIPFMDIVAKSIPVAHRPMLMAYRRTFGGILGGLAGLITLYVLGERSGLEFPMNYVVLFTVGGLINLIAYSCFMATHEPVEPVEAERRPFLTFLRKGAEVFREDRDFRHYFYFRVCLAVTYMSQTLLVPFAMVRFDTPLEATGLFAAGIAIAGGAFSMLWGRIAHRLGEVGLFPVVSAVALAPCVFIAVVSCIPESNGFVLWLRPHFHWVVLAVFAGLTAARQGIDIAGTLYMLAMPPSKLRPVYFAMMNSLSAPLMLSPIAAGWLAGHWSFAAAFVLSALAAVGMLAVSLRLGHR